MNLIKKFQYRFLTGNERSVTAKINIIYMLILKGASIAINLLLVPLTLNYVNSETYGIWLTLSSMIAWISFFDIGINNGLRNKLTEAIAKNNYTLGKIYVSTTYALLSLIFLPLMVILLIIVPYINWEELLNININTINGLIISISIVITYFCLTFILSTINIVMTAFQKPALASLRTLVQHIISLTIIYILTKTTEGNLINLCLALCASPIAVLIFYNFYLFSSEYKKISPNIRYVKFSTVPDLMKLGIKFFIIQVAGIIQYQMVNFLIIRYYGAVEVTNYNIAYKYFGIIFMLWGILTTPLWTAVTDAVTKNDINWIINAKNKYLKILCIFLLCSLFMLIISPWVYNLWIGESIQINILLSSSVMIYYCTIMFGQIFVSILNGWGKLNIQTIASVISPFIFIGCCYLFKYWNWGVYSIVIASCIANFNGIILAPLQLKYHIKKIVQ